MERDSLLQQMFHPASPGNLCHVPPERPIARGTAEGGKEQQESREITLQSTYVSIRRKDWANKYCSCHHTRVWCHHQLCIHLTPNTTALPGQISSPGLFSFPSSNPCHRHCLRGEIVPFSCLAHLFCPTGLQLPWGHPRGHAQHRWRTSCLCLSLCYALLSHLLVWSSSIINIRIWLQASPSWILWHPFRASGARFWTTFRHRPSNSVSFICYISYGLSGKMLWCSFYLFC